MRTTLDLLQSAQRQLEKAATRLHAGDKTAAADVREALLRVGPAAGTRGIQGRRKKNADGS